jgi:hypothetical protein
MKETNRRVIIAYYSKEKAGSQVQHATESEGEKGILPKWTSSFSFPDKPGENHHCDPLSLGFGKERRSHPRQAQTAQIERRGGG